MSRTNHKNVTINTLKLKNDAHVLDCEVEYDDRQSSIFIRVAPVRISYHDLGNGVTGCSRSFKIGGGPSWARVRVGDMHRYNLKALQAVEQGIRQGGANPHYLAYIKAVSEVCEKHGFKLAGPGEEYQAPVLEPGQFVKLIDSKGNQTNEQSWVVVGTDTYRSDNELRYTIAQPDTLETRSFQTATKAYGDARIEPDMLGMKYPSLDKLKADIKAKEDQIKADKEREKLERENSFDAKLAEYKRQYPWAKQDGSRESRAAANIKMQLSLLYPFTRFSCRSSSASMTDSVHVSWENGPTNDEVKKIADQYERGSFDGMCDSYNYDRSTEGEAWRTWMGSTKYASCDRTFSADVVNVVKAALVEKYGDEAANDGYGARTRIHFWNVLHKSVINTSQFLGLEEEPNGDVRAVFAEPVGRPAPVSTSGGGVTVTENTARGGIEIKFASKPEPEIIADVKAHGFRWSKFQKLWWAKASDRTRNFAQALTTGGGTEPSPAPDHFDMRVEDGMREVCGL